MVYYFAEIEKIDDSFIREAYSIISNERKLKAAMFKHKRDKYLSLAVYLLLIYSLKKEFYIPDDINFKYGKNGKPYFKNNEQLFFNLSHTKCGVACGISTNEIGVDIQEIADVNELVMKKVCSPEELINIRCSQNPAIEFAKLWTMKESYLKCIGMLWSSIIVTPQSNLA